VLEPVGVLLVLGVVYGALEEAVVVGGLLLVVGGVEEVVGGAVELAEDV